MKNLQLISDEYLINKILLIRGKRVMLDSDLASLYSVETKVLNQAVKRKISRFPDDFYFQLTELEWSNLKSQFVTSSWGGRRTLPLAFTEQGVAMLSSVLNSEVAIQMNIQIVRIFIRMREMIADKNMAYTKMIAIEKKLLEHDVNLKSYKDDLEYLFNALKHLLKTETTERKKIGFRKDKN
ncbi:MAG: DNA-binding protein [Bacteroidetes bacterium B1(2017)]|nr:MAG: DNA-binding protein [Bacteroidetes bacterium B1(2017)]